MQEQRQSARNNSFVGGQIMAGDEKSGLFYLVRDISDQGAKLEISDVASVPDVFALRVNGKEGLFRARVIWRRTNDLGVVFEAPQSAPNYVLPQAS